VVVLVVVAVILVHVIDIASHRYTKALEAIEKARKAENEKVGNCRLWIFVGVGSSMVPLSYPLIYFLSKYKNIKVDLAELRTRKEQAEEIKAVRLIMSI